MSDPQHPHKILCSYPSCGKPVSDQSVSCCNRPNCHFLCDSHFIAGGGEFGCLSEINRNISIFYPTCPDAMARAAVINVYGKIFRGKFNIEMLCKEMAQNDDWECPICVLSHRRQVDGERMSFSALYDHLFGAESRAADGNSAYAHKDALPSSPPSSFSAGVSLARGASSDPKEPELMPGYGVGLQALSRKNSSKGSKGSPTIREINGPDNAWETVEMIDAEPVAYSLADAPSFVAAPKQVQNSVLEMLNVLCEHDPSLIREELETSLYKLNTQDFIDIKSFNDLRALLGYPSSKAVAPAMGSPAVAKQEMGANVAVIESYPTTEGSHTVVPSASPWTTTAGFVQLSVPDQIWASGVVKTYLSCNPDVKEEEIFSVFCGLSRSQLKYLNSIKLGEYVRQARAAKWMVHNPAGSQVTPSLEFKANSFYRFISRPIDKDLFDQKFSNVVIKNKVNQKLLEGALLSFSSAQLLSASENTMLTRVREFERSEGRAEARRQSLQYSAAYSALTENEKANIDALLREVVYRRGVDRVELEKALSELNIKELLHLNAERLELVVMTLPPAAQGAPVEHSANSAPKRVSEEMTGARKPDFPPIPPATSPPPLMSDLSGSEERATAMNQHNELCQQSNSSVSDTSFNIDDIKSVVNELPGFRACTDDERDRALNILAEFLLLGGSLDHLQHFAPCIPFYDWYKLSPKFVEEFAADHPLPVSYIDESLVPPPQKFVITTARRVPEVETVAPTTVVAPSAGPTVELCHMPQPFEFLSENRQLQILRMIKYVMTSGFSREEVEAAMTNFSEDDFHHLTGQSLSDIVRRQANLSRPNPIPEVSGSMSAAFKLLGELKKDEIINWIAGIEELGYKKEQIEAIMSNFTEAEYETLSEKRLITLVKNSAGRPMGNESQTAGEDQGQPNMDRRRHSMDSDEENINERKEKNESREKVENASKKKNESREKVENASKEKVATPPSAGVMIVDTAFEGVHANIVRKRILLLVKCPENRNSLQLTLETPCSYEQAASVMCRELKLDFHRFRDFTICAAVENVYPDSVEEDQAPALDADKEPVPNALAAANGEEIGDRENDPALKNENGVVDNKKQFAIAVAGVLFKDVIEDHLPPTAWEQLNIGDLANYQYIEVRRQGVENVGPRRSLMVIAAAEPYNQPLQHRVRSLYGSYGSYRKIRGDGNCYYRSICFGLIEHLIANKQREHFGYLYKTFEKVIFMGSGPELDAHSLMLEALMQAEAGTRWQHIEDFEHDILNEGSGIDKAFVRACKKLVATMIMARQNEDFNGLSVKDAILFTYSDCSSVGEFCKNYVLQLDVCAEGIHVNLGFLPTILRCDCHITILPRDGKISTIDTLATNPAHKITSLHILLRPGHYDLLYTGGGTDLSPIQPVEAVKSVASVAPNTSLVPSANSGSAAIKGATTTLKADHVDVIDLSQEANIPLHRHATPEVPNGAATAVAADNPLPSGWKAVLDQKTGKRYYYNKALNKNQWEDPRDELRAQDAVAAAQQQQQQLELAAKMEEAAVVNAAVNANILANADANAAVPSAVSPPAKLLSRADNIMQIKELLGVDDTTASELLNRFGNVQDAVEFQLVHGGLPNNSANTSSNRSHEMVDNSAQGAAKRSLPTQSSQDEEANHDLVFNLWIEDIALQIPLVTKPHIQSLLRKLVRVFEFEFVRAVSSINRGHMRNVRAVIKHLRFGDRRLNFFPEPEDYEANVKDDAEVVKLYLTMKSMGYDRIQLLDALGEDKCTNEDQIIDSIEANTEDNESAPTPVEDIPAHRTRSKTDAGGLSDAASWADAAGKHLPPNAAQFEDPRPRAAGAKPKTARDTVAKLKRNNIISRLRNYNAYRASYCGMSTKELRDILVFCMENERR